MTTYWIESTEQTNYKSLDQDIDIDVCIVGGGICGITCAYILKSKGVKVALIDANRIAMGATGHTTAKITTQHHLIYDKLIGSLGFERAKQYADANLSAIEFISDTVNKLNIDCDLIRTPAYMYTQDENYIMINPQ